MNTVDIVPGHEINLNYAKEDFDKPVGTNLGTEFTGPNGETYRAAIAAMVAEVAMAHTTRGWRRLVRIAC